MVPRFSQLLPSVESVMDSPHRAGCRVKTFTLRGAIFVGKTERKNGCRRRCLKPADPTLLAERLAQGSFVIFNF